MRVTLDVQRHPATTLYKLSCQPIISERLFFLSLFITHIKNKLYLYLAECNTAFGLEGGIEDGQLSALSYYESFSYGNGEVFQAHPSCARKDHHYCAWCAESAKDQHLEVDLRIQQRQKDVEVPSSEY